MIAINLRASEEDEVTYDCAEEEKETRLHAVDILIALLIP